jgi:hypothetical protein
LDEDDLFASDEDADHEEDEGKLMRDTIPD